MKAYVYAVVALFATHIALASEPITPPCDGEDYAARNKELKQIYDADQKDRDDFQKWDRTYSSN